MKKFLRKQSSFCLK